MAGRLPVDVEVGGGEEVGGQDVDGEGPLVPHVARLLQQVPRPVPRLAADLGGEWHSFPHNVQEHTVKEHTEGGGRDADHWRVDEADGEGEGDPGGDGEQQQHLPRLEPGHEGVTSVLCPGRVWSCGWTCLRCRARRAWRGIL